MKLYDLLKVDFYLENEKGRLLQLVHKDYSQVNVITSFAGTERGGHYHKETEEAFFIIEGSIELLLYCGDEREEITFHKNDFFVIHPYVVHEMKFPEDCMMIAMYTTPVERDDGSKDIHIAEEE